MTSFLRESDIENKALEWLKDEGYSITVGSAIDPESSGEERKEFSDVVLVERLKQTINRLNPSIPQEAKDDAIKKVLRQTSQDILENNKQFHKFITDGIDVEYRSTDGRIKGDKVYLFDFKNPENNDFLAVSEFTVIENKHNRRLDIVIFVNGLPLVIIELKDPTDANTNIYKAYEQLQTYKAEIPSIFRYNSFLVISDGVESKAGTISSNKEWFITWKTINGEKKAYLTELETEIKGMLNKKAILDIIKNYIVFEVNQDKTIKKLAAYHQYDAVNKVIKSTREAVTGKDKRAGVIWHTQGSGKSLTMVFYSGKLIQELNNPTIVVLTDRNDLDDQLFTNFTKCSDLLRQKPLQAEDKNDLKVKLQVSSGGVIFTTIQKFLPDNKGEDYPTLSERENIVVIVDEAHRSQYDFIDGLAKNLRDALPKATFVGFTGTPIEKADKSTQNVFGNYVDVYDVSQAVEDKVTVKIFYENRLVKINLKPEELLTIDKDFEELAENEEVKGIITKTKWANLERLVGDNTRIKQVAKDIVEHFSQRQEIMSGKGMIVCMSRRICIDLFNEIIKIKPEWYSKEDKKGYLKVIMTGSATDKAEWQEHIRNKQRRREIGDEFKKPESEIKLVIVRDMWLTGFDVPSLHTMYTDKPMKSHNLMQAIARVNRVFKDKDGGLVVDYIGIFPDLKNALAEYSPRDQKLLGVDQSEAVSAMLEKHDIVKSLFFNFNYTDYKEMDTSQRLLLLINAMDHILKQEKGKERFIKGVIELQRAFALAVPREEATAIRDELIFYQAVKSKLTTSTLIKGNYVSDNLDSTINQLISKAIVSEGIVDVLKVAGISRPRLDLLSEDILLEIQAMPQKNLAREMLERILNDEIKVRFKRNIIKERTFKEILETLINQYTNRSIDTVKVIEELIDLAKNIKKSGEETKDLKLTEQEVAFYDALADNESARELLGKEKLAVIAVEVNKIVHDNATIDWAVKESVQAGLRSAIKKVLRKYGYPPDMQDKAVMQVLEQAKAICEEIVGE
jgi:type I restriction enzyme, R subunit